MGLLVFACIFNTNCAERLSMSVPACTGAQLTRICKGSLFGVAGVCFQVPYHTFTMCLVFPYRWLHVHAWEQKARGPIWGLLAVPPTFRLPPPYNLLTIASMFAGHAELKTNCQGTTRGLLAAPLVMSLPLPYQILIISVMFATSACLNTKC